MNRILTVRDGLPQSYVSGICQDENGFLWIATLNGLGRYDGRTFRNFWHTVTDSAGLRGNIILRMVDVGNKQLLICYSDGRLDLLDVETEKVVHVGGTDEFSVFKTEISFLRGLVSDRKGLCWMVSKDGGVIKLDLKRNALTHFSSSQLSVSEPVLGLAIQGEEILLLTTSQLHVINNKGQLIRKKDFPFAELDVFKERQVNRFSLSIRADGALMIVDAKGIIVWDLQTNAYKKLPLPIRTGPRNLVCDFDASGNYFFEHEGAIYKVGVDNSMSKWTPLTGESGQLSVMLIDRSGVLWVGTNGYGLRQYNLTKTGLPGYEKQQTFVLDVLSHYGLSKEKIQGSFLQHSVPFANRTAQLNDTVWITDRYHFTEKPRIAQWLDGMLTESNFTPLETQVHAEPYGLQFLAYDRSRNLVGIDQHFHLLRFNSKTFTSEILAKLVLDSTEDINGLIQESDGSWFISSTKHLTRLQVKNGKTEDLTGSLPIHDLLTIADDPRDHNILWIGTLSDGLMRYHKKERTTEIYNMKTGLPNNTVYNIVPGSDGALWCSSNKGIFMFQPSNGEVRSFTSRDGLRDDEFNRYYSMTLPDSSIAFGGPLGYTIFKPATIATDTFQPATRLTSISISNFSILDESKLPGKTLELKHHQNFITAEFAAMQFDAPDKIQYRYKLEGFDKQWIITGNQPKATYTSLPPGSYTLLMNSSNTSGRWSSEVLRINIVLSPPFWKTAWFIVLVAAVVTTIALLFIRLRFRSLQKAHAQQLSFERQAMDLHAKSLRAQMNPHFIFNCLNSIKALIQENQNKNAVRYLTSFVSLIRRQLNNTKNEIPIADEIQTCRLYLELEAMRFEGRISYNIDVHDDLPPVSIPPLTLQPLIENAIIHGLLPKEEGGTVYLRVYGDEMKVICEIEDDGIGRVASRMIREKTTRLHESKGVQLLEKRISLFNGLGRNKTTMEINDLVDAKGMAAGTLVTLKIMA